MIREAALELAHLESGKGGSRVDHSSVSASYAQVRLGASGLPNVLATAGHHGGLPNLSYWKVSRPV
ncbi:MAG: hypothetical protein HY611_03460 [Elusimicrobia bacterium]|nr:hypothetical protein [Elusimicrobiota bacterium]